MQHSVAHAVQICHGDVWFHFGRPLRELKLKLAFPSGPCMDGMEDVPLLVCVVLVGRWCVCVCVWGCWCVHGCVRAYAVCCVLCACVCMCVGMWGVCGCLCLLFVCACACSRVCLCVFRYFIYISRHFICVSRYFLCAFEHLYAFPDTANETVPKVNTINIPYLHT